MAYFGMGLIPCIETDIDLSFSSSSFFSLTLHEQGTMEAMRIWYVKVAFTLQINKCQRRLSTTIAVRG